MAAFNLDLLHEEPPAGLEPSVCAADEVPPQPCLDRVMPTATVHLVRPIGFQS
jgi:hypothetical protein